MGHDLMPEQVEVHPGGAATPLLAAQDAAIEAPRRREVVHGKGKMKQGCHLASRFRVSNDRTLPVTESKVAYIV
jgi:hypothetical protein